MMLRNSLRAEQNEEDEKLSKLRVFVDIGDYKERRIENMLKNVNRKVEEARILGEAVDLHPMPASERRQVHLELQKLDDIKTESVGEGRDRFVRIIPSSEEELGTIPEEEEQEE